ncbi:hypothetical protein [Nesterenkonia jeotgali]|uniref:Uncharacterized protein n=1 Tax=Nesterenkonia jeotgali TaxID=317018 RepID=A0A839FVP1_9MICC|nr:hypothetical protein [Nesterenkonia jeotgali]MBA8921913.1 hypothetical protein [Nesterenkonia jeotgali]
MTATTQHTSFTVSAASLDAMIQDNAPDPSNDAQQIIGADGAVLFSAGQAAPGYEEIMDSLAWKQGLILLSRTASTGEHIRGYVWMSPQGIVHTSGDAAAATFTLQAESGRAVFRVLIDVLGLQARPAPSKGFDPARIEERLLWEIISAESGPQHQAREALASAVAGIAPGPAADLRSGEYAVITATTEFNGVQGQQVGRVLAIDTPAGLLMHSEERRLLRSAHVLEPTPAWVLLAQLITTMPQPQDIAWWVEGLPEGR